MKTTRRDFLITSALAALAPRFLSAAPAAKPPLAFSTLGCPQWPFAQILDFAAANSFSAVEIRCILGDLDLPNRPEFAPEHIAATKKAIAAHGLKVSDLGSSSEMHHTDPDKRAKSLADAKRFIELAEKLEAPYVRIYGNKLEGPQDECIRRVAAGMRELAVFAKPHNVTVIIESHGDFVTSPILKQVLMQADHPNAALLWDAHHTFVSGHEEPEVTVRELGSWIKHTHLKDSVEVNGEAHYVLTGKGSVPVQRQMQALAAINYKGYFCFEWEKLWHPDIAEPEIALADFARVAPSYLVNRKTS
jgi:sugar phosphate isomerase/epimerase